LSAAFNGVLILFTFAVVFETKGVSLEQIERKLINGARLRNIGAWGSRTRRLRASCNRVEAPTR